MASDMVSSAAPTPPCVALSPVAAPSTACSIDPPPPPIGVGPVFYRDEGVVASRYPPLLQTEIDVRYFVLCQRGENLVTYFEEPSHGGVHWWI